MDVTTTVEAGLRSATDQAQLDFAIAQHRVIVTGDADFLRLASATPAADHPGIVVCHRQSLSLREMIRGLMLIYEVLTPEEMANHIEYV